MIKHPKDIREWADLFADGFGHLITPEHEFRSVVLRDDRLHHLRRCFGAQLPEGVRSFVAGCCKLWEARSRLHRRRFLQVNTHIAAFVEIYKISIPSHRSNLENSVKNRHQFCEIEY